MEVPKVLGMKNAPKAPMAELKPSTAADSLPAFFSACSRAAAPLPLAACSCRVRKITGIMRKVEPLPMPVVMNSSMNMPRKP
ncbi:hypothetical protein D9M73_233350 [compost metagenome]